MKLFEFNDNDQKFITSSVIKLRTLFSEELNTTFHYSFINHGYCQDFAVILFMLFSKYKPQIYIGVTDNINDGGHAFVKIKNKFYDATFPSGTDSLTKIARNEGVRMTNIKPLKSTRQLNLWNLDKTLVNKVIKKFKKEINK